MGRAYLESFEPWSSIPSREDTRLLYAANKLAIFLHAAALHVEAEPLMHQALSIVERSLGENHPDVATSLGNVAGLCWTTNRPAEAELLMRRMVEIFLKFTGDTGHQHPHFQAAIKNYTKLLSELGHSQPEVQAQINTICKPYGIQFGGGA
jgi:hypothetical protein